MTIEELQAQAETIVGTYRSQIDGIRANRSISEDNRRRQLARAWVQHRDKLDALKQRYTDDRATQRRTLERRIFSPASGAMGATEEAARFASFRDALDRAEQVTDPESAMQLLHRAERVGDGDLSRAVLTVALERGYVDTANAYIAEHPEIEQPIEQLWELHRSDDKLPLHLAMVARHDPAPVDVGGDGELAIYALAGQGD